MSKRAERRTHKQRMKRKAKLIYSGCRCPEKYADHLSCCSCWMCGNPRKHWTSRTRQEDIFYNCEDAEWEEE